MNEKSAKRRLILTISSMCVAVIAVVVSVVAIFAAQQQGVQSTFKVTYRAQNVAATVSANYTVLNETPKTMGSVKIDAIDQPGTVYNNLEGGDIELTDVNNTVYFQYAFKNDSSVVQIKLSLVDSAVKNNVRVLYAYSTSNVAGDSQDLTFKDSFDEVTIAGDETGYVYIKVEIINKANDAEYSTSDAATLTWNLVGVRPADPEPAA